MEFNDLCQEIEKKGYYLFQSDIEKALIDLISSIYTKKKNLHYCWENFRQFHRLKLKIRPTNDFYKENWKNIFRTQQHVFFAVDAECLQGENKLMLIESDKLGKILERFYWELDEIYICSVKFDWLISVNHMFEFNFIGDELIRCIKESIVSRGCQSLIISCKEYE